MPREALDHDLVGRDLQSDPDEAIEPRRELSSEMMRIACADVFERWISIGAERFVAGGVPEPRARELTVAMLAALEGAFVLARGARSTEPLRIAGEVVAGVVGEALASAA
jgi:hypothetical protein